jgi:hypothetical protein
VAPKKISFRRVVAAYQVFVVVTKFTGAASTVFASAKFAARTVAYIMPHSVAELTDAVLAVTSIDAVTIVSVANKVCIQDGHLFYQVSSNFLSVHTQIFVCE